MPREIRCILFSKRDAQLALSSFLASRGDPVDVEHIEQVEFLPGVEGPDAHVHLQRRFGRPDIVVQTAELMAVALLFCARFQVPLPALGVKSLAIAGEKLVLVVMTSIAGAKRSGMVFRSASDESARRSALILVERSSAAMGA